MLDMLHAACTVCCLQALHGMVHDDGDKQHETSAPAVCQHVMQSGAHDSTVCFCLQSRLCCVQDISENIGTVYENPFPVSLAVHAWPVDCSGYLAYEKIVKQLLDGDYYAMYSPAGVDNTQVWQPVATTMWIVTSSCCSALPLLCSCHVAVL